MNIFQTLMFHWRAYRLQRLIRKYRHEHWPTVARLPAPQRGFTLIELMIVVAIVGILAALAVNAASNYSVRAAASEALNLASGVESQIVDTYSSTGAAPSSEPSAGLSGDVQGKFGSLGVYTAGALGYTFNANAPAPLQGKFLPFIPWSTGDGQGTVAWTCGLHSPGANWVALVSDGTSGGGPTSAAATTVPVQYLPSVCRAGTG